MPAVHRLAGARAGAPVCCRMQLLSLPYMLGSRSDDDGVFVIMGFLDFVLVFWLGVVVGGLVAYLQARRVLRETVDRLVKMKVRR